MVDGAVLTFARNDAGDVVGGETGFAWCITGRALSGSLAGRQLVALPRVLVCWFAWATGYPATRLARGQSGKCRFHRWCVGPGGSDGE